MQLIENIDPGVNVIIAVDNSSITLNEDVLLQTCIINNNCLLTDLSLTSLQGLEPVHIEHLLSTDPELIILGSGVQHIFPDVEILDPIATQNIGFEVMNNKSAARTYNILVAEGRKVACLLVIHTQQP
ncbi:hypothetical protein MNBD_GAMMA01-874 [hydrothermal vent metagenome]|uniref:Mth938-like domain-containing protein n=1 Tax=hydrothermal vent metagenome TaxID=652676 RepID=A0A3B0UUF4_9ZZZZ